MNKYPDWSRLIENSWQDGVKNMKPELLDKALEDFRGLAVGSLITEGKTERLVQLRPSFGLTCPRQAYFLRECEKPKPMPDAISMTFTLGHLAHCLAAAALDSGLPEGYGTEYEIQVETGFPDRPLCATTGTADVVFTRPRGDELLPPLAPKHILGDFKTMAGFAFRDHGKKDFSKMSPDAWGHIRQLAVYAHSDTLNKKYPNIVKNGALLIGVNKESPVQGLKSRHIPYEVLRVAYGEVQESIETLDPAIPDPGPVLHKKWGPQVAFYCGSGGRKGYCPFVNQCLSKR